MKGRDSFSIADAAEIKRLLREKVRADRGAQKRIRGRMRELGFYISDFETDQHGFSEADFDQLVSRGTVTVTGRATAPGGPIGVAVPAVEPMDTGSGSGVNEARRRREVAAAKYRPSLVRILLVGEAPPSDLSRYFYFEHVHEHDSLFRYVARGVLAEEPTRTNKPELLAHLRQRGVCLIDLMEDPKVREDHSAHVDGLVRRCQQLRPSAIVLIKASVYDAAYVRLREAGLPVVGVRIPFPGSGQQRKFEELFPQALHAAKRLAD